MKRFGHLIFACVSLTSQIWGQEPVTLTISSDPRGYEIPVDFAGVSIFTQT